MKIVFPTEEEWEVLRSLGLTTPSDIVLIRPDVTQQMKAEDLAAEGFDYDFGGEADVRMDVVASMDHLFVTQLRETLIKESGGNL